MRKSIFLGLIVFLSIFTGCFVTHLYYSHAIDESNQENENYHFSKEYFTDSKDDIIYFDVNDFSGSEVNTIDIPNKVYKNDTISISDSDFKISSELENTIYNTINQYGASNSFLLISLEDGMSVGYNVDRAYETASSIKAPYALFVYKKIAKGEIDPEEVMIYQQQYYNKGTGIVKNSDFGTEYKIKDLLYYSIHESDNIAYIMLHSRYGVKEFNSMLKSLNTKQLYLTPAGPWGFTSARSAAIIWQDIYNFAVTNEYGVEFLNILANAKYNYYKDAFGDIPSASKTGFAYKDVLETGIVFDEKPYIAIAIANKGGNYSAYDQVIKLIKHMASIMNEYKKNLK